MKIEKFHQFPYLPLLHHYASQFKRYVTLRRLVSHGNEFNELERSLNYIPPVQNLSHRFKSSEIFNFELVLQDLNPQ